MALPTRDNIIAIDYSKNGSPWVLVAAKSGIDLDGLDWSKDGSPWWGVEVTAAGNIKKVTGVAWANVKKVSGVAVASIKKITGVAAS